MIQYFFRKQIYPKSLHYFVAIFFLFGCTTEKVPEKSEPVLAIVGDDKITVKEFRYSYETALGSLRQGADTATRKHNYLDFMIKEKLLAEEGYRLGLDKTERVKKAEQKLLNELLINELLEKEVLSKIHVSDKEIQEAINKSKVTFKFRYWVENELARAEFVAADMQKRGYADVTDEIIRKNPERRINPKQLETDYLNYQQITPEVLAAIKDLPYGDISDPVAINGKYFIFQVLDIRRNAVTDNEYKSKASQFEQIVFYEKLRNAVQMYVADLLTPKNIVTKKEASNLLGKALREWQKLPVKGRPDFFVALDEATAAQPNLYRLKMNLDKPFLTSTDGVISTKTFLKYFNVGRVNPKFSGTKSFQDSFLQAVQTSVRDYFMVQAAGQQNLKNSPAVENELKLWRDKWVYSETKRHFTQKLDVTEDEVQDYYEAFQQQFMNDKNDSAIIKKKDPVVKRNAQLQKNLKTLNSIVDELTQRYPVTIYKDILDTVSVQDSEKSRWMSLQVYRGGTNRPAYPSIDAIWSLEGDRH